jgi:DNA-binding transcriptional regulator YdaS (Cro superfamily)
MPRGGAQYRTANLQTDSQRQFLEVAPIDAKPQVSAAAAAAMLNVSERSVATARKVQEYGAPELVAAVDSGITSVSAAALAFVISTNLHRRHLTESQRASIAARLANMRQGGDRRSDQSPNLDFEPAPLAHVTLASAASLLNVSRASVATARKVQEYGAPELVAAVDSGITSVSAAALAFVISTNLHRRHLTESQRASIAARLANIEFGHNQFTRGSANLPTLLPETPPPRSVTPSG